MKAPKMLRTAASAFGLARRTDDIETIEAAIAEARAAIAEGEREEAEAQARYRDALLADDGDPATALRQMQDAKIKRDQGEARAAVLVTRLAEVRAAAEQTRRRGLYEQAQGAAEAARVALLQDYPRLARELHVLLRTLAEAETAVGCANAELPVGAEALISPEAQIRNPSFSRTAPISTTVEMWAPAGGGSPLPDADQAKVRPVPGAPDWRGQLEREDAPPLPVERRTFRKIVEVETPIDHHTANLAGELCLPSLFAWTPPLWPQERNPIRQVVDRSPEATLATLAEVQPLSAPQWRSFGELPTRVRFEEISRHVEREAEPPRTLRLAGPGADRGAAA